MTEILSISATTAGYAMDSMKPARRLSARDIAVDNREEVERNEARARGDQIEKTPGLIPATALALDLYSNDQHPEKALSPEQVENAYRDT